ncbi:MAG: ATP-binding protein [Candidatus Omnitrophica bacterium]|nr:ATP-binding protein [Candidatus Omnitrophota bacterium]
MTVRLAKASKQLKYSGQSEKPCMVLEVEDTGIGIPSGEIEKVFYRGFRAGNVGDVPGTGLGLEAVYMIVHQMYGNIEAVSELGKGSKFTVYLPLVVPEKPAASPVGRQPANGGIDLLEEGVETRGGSWTFRFDPAGVADFRGLSPDVLGVFPLSQTLPEFLCAGSVGGHPVRAR